MLITRRELLCWGGGAALLSMVPVHAASRMLRKNTLTKSLWLYNTHTGEFVREAYWHQGKYIPSGVRYINRLLRDHRSNEIKPLSLDVFNLLYQMQTLLGYRKPLDVISGYRSPKTNARLRSLGSGGVAKNSYHTKGMAIDVHFRGLSLMRARQAACFLARGGVGYYPSDRFIHLDVRGHLAKWSG